MAKPTETLESVESVESVEQSKILNYTLKMKQAYHRPGNHALFPFVGSF